MALKDLIPWNRKRAEVGRAEGSDPWSLLEADMTRLFSQFFGRPPLAGLTEELSERVFSPRVNIFENEREVKVTADLPGIEEKDVAIEYRDHRLFIRGERRQAKEFTRDTMTYSETSYGSFHRTIALPKDVDADHIAAEFTKGVLTVTIPKTAPAETAKKVRVTG